jgi:glyoxylase-like metal-dependent hydrolase (beta-lactamase superfamily II)
MPHEIKTINLGGVNCYLVKSGDGGYILVDTGQPEKRADMEKALESAGCKPENLKLIVLTHGDYDHAGNAAYLREKYAAKIAMHVDDSGRVERGDWNWNFKAKPDKFSLFFRIVSFFVKAGKFDTFKADIYVEDGQSLSAYGSDAKVLCLPGHTKGSIGVLTTGGELFCGDLMDNIFGKPDLEFFIDDMAAANASLEKLKRLEIKTVYPGHGNPFTMERFVKIHR